VIRKKDKEYCPFLFPIQYNHWKYGGCGALEIVTRDIGERARTVQYGKASVAWEIIYRGIEIE